MKQSWKVALAYTAFNFAVLGIIALFAWASPGREVSDYDFAYGMFIGASIYPMTTVIDGTINRRRTTEPEPQIIRTTDELAALDPDTVLGVWHPDLDGGCILMPAREWADDPSVTPLSVIATGDQIRAARQALENTE